MVKIKITKIHKYDAYYNDRDEIVGCIGFAENIENTGHGWYSFDFRYDGQWHRFMYADFEQV